MTMNKTSITSGQRKQYLRFVEDAAEKALKEVGLDKDGLQKLIENGDEFQARIIAGIRKLSVSNQFAFADEEVKSSYGYTAGYSPKKIGDQIDILLTRWPTLNPDSAWKCAKSGLVIPQGAEAPFCIIRSDFFDNSYNVGVTEILAAIKAQRKGKFHNCCKGKLGEQYLRQHERTVKKLQVLGDQQKDYDILVVPSQFGLCHRGRSVRRAREVFTTNEFGLGAFEIGCMLLTHPERLVSYDDLWIDCAGDEYALLGDGVFLLAPFFFFRGGRVRFDSRWIGDASSDCGSASGFVEP